MRKLGVLVVVGITFALCQCNKDEEVALVKQARKTAIAPVQTQQVTWKQVGELTWLMSVNGKLIATIRMKYPNLDPGIWTLEWIEENGHTRWGGAYSEVAAAKVAAAAVYQNKVSP